MSAPKFRVKPIIVTSLTGRDTEKLYAVLESVVSVMNWAEDVQVEPFAVWLNDNIKLARFVDGKGQVRIEHQSFYENITKPALELYKKTHPGYQFIIIRHFTEAEKKRLGLEPTINGSYWLDKNWYMEAWVASDLDTVPASNRTRFVMDSNGHPREITNLERLLLHEGGHAFVHFSGRQGELEARFGGDPVHYLDYGLKDVSRVFHEVSFRKWSLMAYIIALANQVIELLTLKKSREEVENTPVNKPSRLDDWAMAIQVFEDYVPPGGKYRDGKIATNGSLSYRNHNPGNLRWSPYEAGNRNNFSYFNSYADGWRALQHQLKIAADGRSKVYRPDMTLREFFNVYAPSEDNNFPEVYAKFVADYMKVSVETPIKNLI